MKKVEGEAKGPQLSPEEVTKRRDEITKFYKDQLPHLRIQAEYEELTSRIEEARAKKLQAQAFLAQAYETMEYDEDVETPKAEAEFKKASKTLKKTNA